MRPVEAVFAIPAADVRLYATDHTGNPLSTPVWAAKCFNQIRITERKLQKRTMPTGARYRVNHDIDESHEIQIDSLLDIDAIPGRNTYWVLYIELIQADQLTTSPWRSRTYFGATHRTLEAAGRDGNEMAQTQVFDAQFYNQEAGVGSPTGPDSIHSSS